MGSPADNARRVCIAALRAGTGAIAMAIGAAAMLDGACVLAQTTVKTDASFGRTPQTLAPVATAFTANSGATLNVPGNLYVIPQTLGSKAGGNLFHSFESFRVGTGDAAVFTTAENFNNVISRVSGSTPTTINGILSLQPLAGTRPNFFFLNPNGVVFGNGAQVDMPGAFHVSTANRLRFTDDTVFKAGAGADSTLTIAAPAAFGFLGTTRASVSVIDGTSIETLPGRALTVAAGDVKLQFGVLITQGGGDIRVAAVGNDVVEVPIAGALPAMHGNLDIVAAGIATTTFGNRRGGNIEISAGNITIQGPDQGGFSGIASIVLPDASGPGGNVTIAASGTLTLLFGGLISSENIGVGAAGSIAITASTLTADARGNYNSVDIFGNEPQTGILSCGCVPGGTAQSGAVSMP